MEREAQKHNQLTRRTIVKAATWSVPVVAAAVALPMAAASAACTEPDVARGVGTWLVNGPKDAAAGYLGWRANATQGSRRYYYSEGSALDFSWAWTAAGDATGAIPVGTQIRIGVGGEATLDAFWIESFPVPVASSPSVQYTGTTGPNGNWYVFTVTAPITPGTVITWTSTITLKSTFPVAENVASNFGAFAQVRAFADTAICPAEVVAAVTASEWSTSASTSGLGTYVITSQFVKNNPGHLQ